MFTFALLYGVKLMPRIRNWKELRFLRPTRGAHYKYIDKLFCSEAADLIESGWQDVMQVAISIVEGKVSSPRLLRKLGSYSRRIELYFAAKAAGEVDPHNLLASLDQQPGASARGDGQYQQDGGLQRLLQVGLLRRRCGHRLR